MRNTIVQSPVILKAKELATRQNILSICSAIETCQSFISLHFKPPRRVTFYVSSATLSICAEEGRGEKHKIQSLIGTDITRILNCILHFFHFPCIFTIVYANIVENRTIFQHQHQKCQFNCQNGKIYRKITEFSTGVFNIPFEKLMKIQCLQGFCRVFAKSFPRFPYSKLLKTRVCALEKSSFFMFCPCLNGEFGNVFRLLL